MKKVFDGFKIGKFIMLKQIKKVNLFVLVVALFSSFQILCPMMRGDSSSVSLPTHSTEVIDALTSLLVSFQDIRAVSQYLERLHSSMNNPIFEDIESAYEKFQEVALRCGVDKLSLERETMDARKKVFEDLFKYALIIGSSSEDLVVLNKNKVFLDYRKKLKDTSIKALLHFADAHTRVWKTLVLLDDQAYDEILNAVDQASCAARNLVEFLKSVV